MAKGFSKAVVMGNLVRDPETKQTNSGHSVTSFTLAVNGRNDDVAYIDCTAWNKGGEATRCLSLADLTRAAGKIRTAIIAARSMW